MKKLSYIIIYLISGSFAFSQNNINAVLSEIELNNTTLAAYRKNSKAEITGNKTGLFPENPEVQFGYLWGSPDMIGNRTDIEVTQAIDFPTVYVYQSQISSIKNEQEEQKYMKQRNSIILQGRLLCAELTYLNAMSQEYQIRLKNNQVLANAYKRKMELGETSILEHNKAQINLLNTEKQLEKINIERNSVLQQLQAINGGKQIVFNDSVFVTEPLESDFEIWYASAEKNNPILGWVKNEAIIAEKENKLSMAKSLPKISAGYMSEKVLNEQFAGITLGISIPLWENKNEVKYSKLKAQAAESFENDAKLQFYNNMKRLHKKAVALQLSVEDYKLRIKENNNIALLEKALKKGEISLSEYYYELMVYYDSKEKLLDMEKELQNCIAQLRIYN